MCGIISSTDMSSRWDLKIAYLKGINVNTKLQRSVISVEIQMTDTFKPQRGDIIIIFYLLSNLS